MDILNRLSIRVKLFTLVGILLAMMTSIAGYALFKLDQIGTELHGIVTEDIPLTEITTDITAQQFRTALLIEQAVQQTGIVGQHLPSIQSISSQIDLINRSTRDEIRHAETLMQQILQHAASPDMYAKAQALSQALVTVKTELADYQHLTARFLQDVEQSDLDTARLSLTTLDQKQSALLTHLQSLLSGIEKLTERALLQAEEHEVSALHGMLLIGIAGICCGLACSYLFTNAMTRPLKSAVHASSKMAGGDLTVSLRNSGSDEISELTNTMDTMARNLEGAIHQVLNSSSQIASAAGEMAVTADQTNHAIAIQHGNTEQITLAINEMVTTIQQIADNTGTTALKAETAQQQVEQGQSAVADNLNKMNLLVTQIRTASQEIAAAREQSDKIVDFVEDISDITEQTNLLALNAAIEAARAGEQGRGFSVVADEVRKLATKTQETTAEIRQFVDTLKLQTDTAYQAIEQTDHLADSSSSQAALCNQLLETITQSIDELSMKNIEVATICEQQSAAAEEINRNIVSISESGGEVKEGSALTARSSEELAHLAAELKRTMAHFKLTTVS